MCKPVKVEIIPTVDKKVTDSMLYSEGVEDRTKKINISILREAVGNSTFELTIQLLNSILIQDSSYIRNSINVYRQEVKKAYLRKGIPLIEGQNMRDLQSQIIADSLEQCLLSGIYKVKDLLDDEFEEELLNIIKNPVDEHVNKLREYLNKAYGDDPKYKGKYIISMLIVNQYEEGMDIEKTVQNYFIRPDKKSVKDILEIIKEG